MKSPDSSEFSDVCLCHYRILQRYQIFIIPAPYYEFVQKPHRRTSASSQNKRIPKSALPVLEPVGELFHQVPPVTPVSGHALRADAGEIRSPETRIEPADERSVPGAQHFCRFHVRCRRLLTLVFRNDADLILHDRDEHQPADQICNVIHVIRFIQTLHRVPGPSAACLSIVLHFRCQLKTDTPLHKQKNVTRARLVAPSGLSNYLQSTNRGHRPHYTGNASLVAVWIGSQPWTVRWPPAISECNMLKICSGPGPMPVSPLQI